MLRVLEQNRPFAAAFVLYVSLFVFSHVGYVRCFRPCWLPRAMLALFVFLFSHAGCVYTDVFKGFNYVALVLINLLHYMCCYRWLQSLWFVRVMPGCNQLQGMAMYM